MDGAQVAERPIHSYPPWLLERANGVQVGMGNLRKEDNPLEVQYFANEFLEKSYKHFLKIYTDGSVLDDGRGRCRICCSRVQQHNPLILSTSSVDLHCRTGGHSNGPTTYERDSYSAVSYSHL